MFGNDDWVDLGDYPLGYTEPKEESYYEPPYRAAPVVYQYYFKDYQDLATSDVFQKALTMALAHKDREIESLRNEIMELS